MQTITDNLFSCRKHGLKTLKNNLTRYKFEHKLGQKTVNVLVGNIEGLSEPIPYLEINWYSDKVENMLFINLGEYKSVRYFNDNRHMFCSNNIRTYKELDNIINGFLY